MTESSRTGGDLRQEQRRIYLGVGRALLFCTVVYASAFLLLPRIAHYPHSLEGRLAFLAAYPRGAGARSFGMAVTMLPSMLAFVLAVATAFARLSS